MTSLSCDLTVGRVGSAQSQQANQRDPPLVAHLLPYLFCEYTWQRVHVAPAPHRPVMIVTRLPLSRRRAAVPPEPHIPTFSISHLSTPLLCTGTVINTTAGPAMSYPSPGANTHDEEAVPMVSPTSLLPKPTVEELELQHIK